MHMSTVKKRERRCICLLMMSLSSYAVKAARGGVGNFQYSGKYGRYIKKDTTANQTTTEQTLVFVEEGKFSF